MADIGRLAPSPSGSMHLGNAFSALLAWLSARSAGGGLVLRLEDLDKPRCPRAYALGVMEDLRWLGLDWDGAPLWQSERDGFYQEVLCKLESRGLLYPCYCSRRDLHPPASDLHPPCGTPSPTPIAGTPSAASITEASAPHGTTPVYPGTCRHLTPEERAAREAMGRRVALRIRVPDVSYTLSDGLQGAYTAQLARDVGDFLLRRSDGLYAYQLAVVADDGAQGVTQVVRGRDLLPSTPQQLWLQDVLGLPHPQYYHVPLLLAPDGRRLSKREGDLSLRALSRSHSPQELVGRLACWAGLLPEPIPMTPAQLLPRFSWDKVKKEDVVVS